MNYVSETFHGLKAAKQLLVLFEGYVGEGQVQIKNIAIDFDDGKTREFTSAQYFDLAKEALDTVIASMKLAYGEGGQR